MDKQEYLNQISASTTASTKPAVKAFWRSKFFWTVIGCIVFMVLVLVVGNVATSGRVTMVDRVGELLIHIEKTSDIIDEYQSDLKSSILRGYSASLSSVLADTDNRLATFAAGAYGYKPKNIDEEVKAAAEEAYAELYNELFRAKINGELDNFYDLKMVYEITTILTQEQAILDATKNEELTAIVTTSFNSLMNLYAQFDGFGVGM